METLLPFIRLAKNCWKTSYFASKSSAFQAEMNRDNVFVLCVAIEFQCIFEAETLQWQASPKRLKNVKQYSFQVTAAPQ